MPTLTTNDVKNDIANTVDQSGYGTSLENTAPNVTSLIESVRVNGETWFAALKRSLPFMNATHQQTSDLQSIIARAESGLPPINIPTPTESIKNLVMYLSLGAVLYRIVKGV